MTEEPNTIIGSIRQINGIIEEMVRKIHKQDIQLVCIKYTDLANKVDYMSNTFPNLKNDIHFQHLVHAVQDFKKEINSEERIHKPNEYWSKLEGEAAKILAASQKIHGEKHSPFGFLGRLFR